MSKGESVSQILKEIVMKATKEYLDAPAPPNLPKTNTQKNISEKTGINATTLNRYLNPSEVGSCPNLVEAMEILRVINKREALIEFGKRSNCHAAKFIKDFYGKYIESNQLEAETIGVSEQAPLTEDFMKIINDHQLQYDKKLHRHWQWVMWIMIIMSYVSMWQIHGKLDDFKHEVIGILRKN